MDKGRDVLNTRSFPYYCSASIGRPTLASMNRLAPSIKFGRARRRSKRLGLSVPVQVYGLNACGESFREFTRMLSVNAYGGLLALAARVEKGQTILVVNRTTRREQDCRVVDVGPAQNGQWSVGVTFAHPTEDFWQIYFPPTVSR